MSQLVRAKISALGTYVPPRLLTNADLEKMVETSNDWIVDRVGIRERHIVDKGVATSDLAVAAAKCALTAAWPRRQRHGSDRGGNGDAGHAVPLDRVPGAEQAGGQRGLGFDISAACSAFVYALQTGAQFIQSGRTRRSW